jgi:hypothetical protein
MDAGTSVWHQNKFRNPGGRYLQRKQIARYANVLAPEFLIVC